MEFDEENWVFPVERLKEPKLYVCTRTDGDPPKRTIFGGRLEFAEISLPDDNYLYEKERVDEFHVSLDFHIDAATLEGIEKGKDYASTSVYDDHSVYAFGTHNYVNLKSVVFGDLKGDKIEVKITIEFDFESSGSIGGVFEHTVETYAVLEIRS